ncbi:hypothetical protein [Microcella sp.]|uniref:FMN-binding protein n=1 Tax=Microcella sp. TaxID=1913979 RepID=UPI00299F69E0|nr:hypothetical protein [Microcella sp.]MDX2025756.1 hypothetical protein [Microcella sp.]
MISGTARTTAARIAVPLGVSVALLGTITGCSTAAPAEPAEPVDASYRDGVYQANGPYESPNGAENIIVVIELENDIVTDVEITVNPNNPTTADFQGQFADGIGDLVIGEDIDSLNVTVVAGSSLTSNGFREALKAIKADALEG